MIEPDPLFEDARRKAARMAAPAGQRGGGGRGR